MRTAGRRIPNATSPASSVAAETRAIPFDYAFRYELEGTPGKVLNSIVSVSIEAMFTAVSMGYGVVPRVQPIIFGPEPPSVSPGVARLVPQALETINLADIARGLDRLLRETSTTLRGETGAEAVFRNGLKLNPTVAEFALQTTQGSDSGPVPLSVDILQKLFQVVGSPPELIQFKYAIFDEGSGREFQSEPILNIAGLGSAAGERPFRYFAQPITFRPRSTIRMEITEISDFKGELHVVLHGYKVLAIRSR